MVRLPFRIEKTLISPDIKTLAINQFLEKPNISHNLHFEPASNMGVLSSTEGAGNIPYQRAHLDDTRGPITIAACAVLSVLSTLATFLKILVRRQTKAKFGADDYTIFVTLVCIKNDARSENLAKIAAGLCLGFVRMCLLWYDLRPHV